MPRAAILCNCSRSVAAVAAIFSGLAAAAWIVEGRCREAGGRVSDSAWLCELSSGATASLWSLLPPLTAGLVALAVGVPVYLAVNTLGQRWIRRGSTGGAR